jgi:hypothetical protein
MAANLAVTAEKNAAEKTVEPQESSVLRYLEGAA